MAIIWITHDLGIAASIANRISVMYGGFIIEEAPVSELYAHPTHPYTIGLLNSLPQIQERGRKRLYSIEGMPPVLYQMPHSCPFAPRCKWVVEHCWHENPPLDPISNGHTVACWVDTVTGKER